MTSKQDLAGADSSEGDEPAKIELTYSTLQAINRARLAFDMPALRIIQVIFDGMLDFLNQDYLYLPGTNLQAHEGCTHSV